MKIVRKTLHYLKYLIGLFLQSPKLIFKEFLEDYQKDKKAINIKKNHYIVWICSLPKSGSTLIEEIISFYPYVKLDRSLTRFFSKGDLKDVHDISKEMFESAPKNKLSFIKTHTHYDETIINICKKYEIKVIITFRDLRDVIISRYFHVLADQSHRHHKIISKMPQKEGFIKSFEINDVNEEALMTYYYNWIKSWQLNKKSINHLELWYEDYVNNKDFFLEKIMNFIDEDSIGISNLKEFLKKEEIAKRKKTFQNLIRDKSKKVSTFRSGKINNWKLFFDEETTKRFNNSLPGPLDNILRKK